MDFPYYIFAWIASIAYGAEVIVGKLLSKHGIKNPWMLNFFWSVFATVIMIPLAVKGGLSVPSDWGALLASSVLSGIAGLLFILVLYYFDATIVGSIYNVRAAFTVLVGVIFLGEALTTKQVGLTVIILAAGMFVTAEENWTFKSLGNRGMVLALFNMVILSFFSMFTKISINENGYWTTTLANTIVPLLLFIFTAPLFKKDVHTLNKGQIWTVIILSCLSVLGTVAINKAYQTNIGLTSVITALPLSMIAAFVFSYFAPKLLEKHTLKIYAIRFSAAAVMIICALNLT